MRKVLVPALHTELSPGRWEGGVEFRQLRFFVTLAEELHFGRAAAREHIVGRASHAPPFVASELVRLDPLGILVTDSHPFAALPSIPVPMLSAEPLLLSPDGLTWRMLVIWGIATRDLVRYTLVSGLWNIFARLGLPVIALMTVAIRGRPGGVPAAVAYCGAGALLVAMAGFQACSRACGPAA